MPVLRLLAEGASAFGSPATTDVDGVPCFPVAAGDTVEVTMDCTGWLGLGDTLSGSAWSGDLDVTSPATSGGVATGLVAIPADPTIYYRAQKPYGIAHTATASDGRVRVTNFYLISG